MYCKRDNLISGIKMLLLAAIFFVSSIAAYSHFEEGVQEEGSLDIGEYIKSTSTNSIIIVALISGILIIFSIIHKEKTEKVKWMLFLGISIPVLLVTFYSAGSTIYLNVISETKGPVHWHADFEIWNCREKLDLISPKGLSNRIGSPLFHEHGDNRIHVEGVITDTENVDLHSFFETVGGYLDDARLSIPTDQNIINIKDGDLCNGNLGKLQVFLYKIKNPEANRNWIFEQQKLDDFEDYILSPYTTIPPGDCIIIEFDAEKGRTEQICETYKVAVQRGDLSGS